MGPPTFLTQAIGTALEPFGQARRSPPATATSRARDFADLYAAQFDRLYRYLRYRLDDPALAEDLTAEVFVRAWSKLERVTDDSAVAWLFVTARRLIADHYRGQRGPLSLEALPPANQPATASPDHQFVADEDQARLLCCLGELAEREREIIALRFLADLRHREIARAVGTSEGNVAKILHRALRKLRARLHDEENDHA